MNRRSAILYVTFALVLGMIYFLASRFESRKTEEEARESRIFALEIDQVDALKIQRSDEPEVLITLPGKETAEQEQTERLWQIIEPGNFAADQQSVSEVIEEAVSIEKKRTIEATGADPAEFGFDTPPLRVSIQADGEWHTLEFGDENFSYDGRYVHVIGKPEIFIVEMSAYNRLDRTLAGLRDRDLLSIERDAIRGITLERGDDQIRLTREKDGWRLHGTQRPISGTAVDGLIATLTKTEIVRFVSEVDGDRVLHGLDSPDVSATFALEEGEAGVGLSQGPDGSEEAELFAFRSTAPGVVTVAVHLLERLPGDPADLEDRRLFRGIEADVDTVTLTHDGLTLQFTRRGEEWARAEGAKDGGEEPPDVRNLITLLGSLQHEGAPNSRTAASGDAQVEIQFASSEGQSILEISIWPEEEDAPDRRGRMTDDSPARAIAIATSTINSLYDSLRELDTGAAPALPEPEPVAPPPPLP